MESKKLTINYGTYKYGGQWARSLHTKTLPKTCSEFFDS